MCRLSPHLLPGLLVVACAAGGAAGSEPSELVAPDESVERTDPYFGEALFYAYQGRYFDALERLDAELAQYRGVDEPGLDPLHRVLDRAEFSVGDFELHYRMHHRAGRAIKAVLEADVPDPVRNEAAFRLARLHYQKGQPGDALAALARIEGEVPAALQADPELLRANVLMALDRPVDAAEVLRGVQASEALEGFASYNLGIALLRAEQPEAALRQLDRAGRVGGRGPETAAIRDKANLVLGTMLIEASEFDGAHRSLDRVRLEGPFSNRALLGAGWAHLSADQAQRALVPWSLLVERDSTDDSVQEALLALPHAYSQLDVHSRAAVLYERAVTTFGQELAKVTASIESIRTGEFLEALVREEIHQDEDWVIRLRSLPDAPETFYLISLMASHDFQTALQNYLDLEDLRTRLASWKRGLDAFEDITRRRRAYYEPLLPDIDRRFRRLDAQMRLRLEQRKHLRRRLDQMLTAPNPDLLATSSERALAARLDALEAAASAKSAGEASALHRRIRRLRGLVAWSRATEYHERLTDAHAHLRELDADVEVLEERYESFVRARQAAVHGYAGYRDRIDDLRSRVATARTRIDALMSRQGRLLESVAIRELRLRRDRLADYQNRARFAFADSYDRAVKARAR